MNRPCDRGRRRALAGLGSGLISAAASTAATGCAFPARIFGGNLEALASDAKPPAQRLADPRRPGARLVTTWVGHATVLVQMDDAYFLTDPVLENTVGLLSARLVEPGLTPAAIPPLDATIVSHMHFDHLSLGSLDAITHRVGTLAVPRGAIDYLPNYRFDVAELAPDRPVRLGRLEVTAVPVMHSGWRYGLDAIFDPPSFTGYVVRFGGMTVYFGGDTAYEQSLFTQVAATYGPIDLAILPIAPIHPRDFMESKHVDPGEAVQAFVDLGARFMQPMHFETFINSLDEPGEPEAKLRAAMDERGLTDERVAILRQGEQRVWLA